ncbi:MAG: hypothetical protein CME06_02805 [Gemmatimonadetes bacterium]|nr:hypothetical protein [Gemmatimonadota bacterium]
MDPDLMEATMPRLDKAKRKKPRVRDRPEKLATVGKGEHYRRIFETMLFDAEQGSGRALACKLFNLEASYTLHGLNVAGVDGTKFSFISFGGQDRKGSLTPGLSEVPRLHSSWIRGRSLRSSRRAPPISKSRSMAASTASCQARS